MAHTVRVREEWASQACKDAGGVVAWAQALGIDKGTASRQRRGTADASPAFIGAVLANYPIRFDAAFEVVETK